MFSVEFLELAQNELDDTFEYYEFQQENLGYRFILVDALLKLSLMVSFIKKEKILFW